MQNTYERLAFSVRTARKRENITQAELAERLKLSIRTIQGIENCKGNPKFETIILLCRELNISLDAVLYAAAFFPIALSPQSSSTSGSVFPASSPFSTIFDPSLWQESTHASAAFSLSVS